MLQMLISQLCPFFGKNKQDCGVQIHVASLAQKAARQSHNLKVVMSSILTRGKHFDCNRAAHVSRASKTEA